jgi:hypothetical protein
MGYTLLVECVPPSRINGATTGVNVCFFAIAVAVALVHALTAHLCTTYAPSLSPWRLETAVHALWVGSLTVALQWCHAARPTLTPNPPVGCTCTCNMHMRMCMDTTPPPNQHPQSACVPRPRTPLSSP